MTDLEKTALAEEISDLVIEKLTAKKYRKIKSEKRHRLKLDFKGIRKIKKSEIIK